MENSRPKPGRMEETLEGGRGPPRAVEPLERERESEREQYGPRYWGDEVKEDEMGGMCTTVWAQDLKKGTTSES